MKTDNDYKKLKSEYESLYKLYSFYKYLSMFLVLTIVLPKILDRISEIGSYNDKLAFTSHATIWSGVAGNLNIQTKNCLVTETGKMAQLQSLSNIKYAKLDLLPTIGCSKPTLIYVDENYRIHKLSVDEAKIK